MITIDNTSFTSNQSLTSILSVLTKSKMMDICKKLELYVSPNLKKDETARRWQGRYLTIHVMFCIY